MTATTPIEAPPIKILLVDDEPLFRKMLSTFLSKYPGFQIFEAENGEEGIRIALETKPDLIISDYYMPVLDGIEFCRRVKSIPELASVIFLVLTVEKAVDRQVKAFEYGADDYIEKTTSPVVLTSKITAFLRIKQLQKELRIEKDKLVEANTVLERNFSELTAILLKIVDLRLPGAADRAGVAKLIAEHICEKLGIPDDIKQKIVFGAQLHEIGKIALPDNIADKSVETVSPAEKATFNQYPIIGSSIVSAISGFKSASDAICRQLENYDGTGTPDGLIAEEIVIGGRIIRSIIFQEELFKKGRPKEEIIQEIRQSANKIIAPPIATYLAEFIIESDKDFSISKHKVRIEELEAGMVIAEDVYAASGVKLIPKGIKLQEHMLQVLMERNSRDPIIGGVYVLKTGNK
jgi:response regulator RpfG family c-di-GMP phosphodiesterase